MTKPFNRNIRRALGLAQELQDLAEQGDRERNDESCSLLYSRMQESAQAILALAEREMEGHKAKNKWD